MVGGRGLGPGTNHAALNIPVHIFGNQYVKTSKFLFYLNQVTISFVVFKQELSDAQKLRNVTAVTSPAISELKAKTL